MNSIHLLHYVERIRKSANFHFHGICKSSDILKLASFLAKRQRHAVGGPSFLIMSHGLHWTLLASLPFKDHSEKHSRTYFLDPLGKDVGNYGDSRLVTLLATCITLPFALQTQTSNDCPFYLLYFLHSLSSHGSLRKSLLPFRHSAALTNNQLVRAWFLSFFHAY